MGNDPITGACDIKSQTPSTRPRPELEEHFESASGGSMAEQAGAAKEKLKQKGREAANRVSAAVDDAGRQMKEQAGEATRRVKDQGATLLAQQKDRLAGEIEHFSTAAHEAADKLDEQDDCNVAHYLHTAADRIDDVACYLRDSNVRTLVDDVSHMARRRPEVFFGGMFIAGMALARFLKASGTPRHRAFEDFGTFDEFDEYDNESLIIEDFDESEVREEEFGAGIGTSRVDRGSMTGANIPAGHIGTTAGSTGSFSSGSMGTAPIPPTSLKVAEEEKRHGDKLSADRGSACPPGTAGQEVL